MSTFDGYVEEFPDIASGFQVIPFPAACLTISGKVDHFRPRPGHTPLVYFLSHIHSDHREGLETVGKVKTYCSPTTRELLLNLQTSRDRMLYSSGILEHRIKPFAHLKNVLKAIPLRSPIDIELRPHLTIRVTLFDANHCPGAVMFLIQSSTRNVLYTGDIRAETWWVDAFVREPCMTSIAGNLRALDKIYLDTTFALQGQLQYRFPTKKQGREELLKAVLKYPTSTVFHLRSWTFGYEEVWQMLSHELRTQVHLDDYQYNLYKSLAHLKSASGAEQHSRQDAQNFIGFQKGNKWQEGCLTRDINVRIHSCERGTGCSTPTDARTVTITPILCRGTDGTTVFEVGAGSGGQDLRRNEIKISIDSDLFTALCNKYQEYAAEGEVKAAVLRECSNVSLTDDFDLTMNDLSLDVENTEINVEDLIPAILQSIVKKARPHPIVKSPEVAPSNRMSSSDLPEDLSQQVYFPYSRHSSYEELRYFIKQLRPQDIHPCTFDPKHWSEAESIGGLFGDLCSGDLFSYDERIRRMQKDKADAGSRLVTSEDLAEQDRVISGIRAPSGWSSKASEPKEDFSLEVLTFKKRRLRGSFHSPHSTSPQSPDKRKLPTGTNVTKARQDPQGEERTHKSMMEIPSQKPNAKHVEGSRMSQPDDSIRYRPIQGTQAAPINISDSEDTFTTPRESRPDHADDVSKQGQDDDDAQRESQCSLSSHVSMPDSAFESQLSNGASKKDPGQTRRRREAYEHAKDGMFIPRSSGIVSSGDNHRDEEMEV